jgi:hypothetical protein
MVQGWGTTSTKVQWATDEGNVSEESSDLYLSHT